jgi:hypothetical protein
MIYLLPTWISIPLDVPLKCGVAGDKCTVPQPPHASHNLSLVRQRIGYHKAEQTTIRACTTTSHLDRADLLFTCGEYRICRPRQTETYLHIFLI